MADLAVTPLALALELPEGLKPSKSKRSRESKHSTDVSSSSSQVFSKNDVVLESLPNGGQLSISKAAVVPRPDGRRCDTCPNRDNQEDVCIRQLKKMYEDAGSTFPEHGPWDKTLRRSEAGIWLQWWGYSPDSTSGLTKGNNCGVCNHIYSARHRCRKISLKAWKTELGSNSQLLDAHQNLVKVTCTLIAQKGCNFRAHVDWLKADSQALILCKSLRMRKTRPGYSWQPKWYCPPYA